MPTLSEQLQSLGVKIGARDLRPPLPRSVHAIEQVVEGRLHATERGDAFVVETTYPTDYRHGRATLAMNASLNTIAAWARDERLARVDPTRLLFLDTETTGLAGGTGTYAFLVGVGRFDGTSFRLAQFFMRDPIEEGAMLAALLEFLDRCDGLVTFNGKWFDVPLLCTRYIVNGHEPPLASFAHLDLLPLARRLWRQRLESRALSALEKHILGAERAEADVPGWQIPQMYFDYLRTGDARPLTRVFYHNAMDVLAMTALLSHVAQMLDDPLTFAVEHGLDLIAIGKIFEPLGRLDEAARVYARALELDLSEQAFRETVARLSFVEKRRGQYTSAVKLWRDAARRREIYAHVELAKYCEHTIRDYVEAAEWTRRALAIVRSVDSTPEMRRAWQADLERRLARLESKMSMDRDEWAETARFNSPL